MAFCESHNGSSYRHIAYLHFAFSRAISLVNFSLTTYRSIILSFPMALFPANHLIPNLFHPSSVSTSPFAFVLSIFCNSFTFTGQTSLSFDNKPFTYTDFSIHFERYSFSSENWLRLAYVSVSVASKPLMPQSYIPDESRSLHCIHFLSFSMRTF